MKLSTPPPVLAFLTSLTLSQINDIAGVISFILASAYTIWRWRREYQLSTANKISNPRKK